MRDSCLQLLTSCVQFSHDLFQDGYIFSFYQSARNENNKIKYVSVVMGTSIIVFRFSTQRSSILTLVNCSQFFSVSCIFSCKSYTWLIHIAQ